MKKVKIMLTAVAVLAVVGGSLAFKAHNYNSKKIFLEGATPGVCDIELTSRALTVTSILPSIFVSDVPGGDCVLTYTKPVTE